MDYGVTGVIRQVVHAVTETANVEAHPSLRVLLQGVTTQKSLPIAL